MLIKTIWQGRLGGLRLIMMLAVFTLVGIGLVNIHASGRTSEFNKQLFWVVISLGGFSFVNLFHYRRIGETSYFWYVLTLFLLVLVLVGKKLGLDWLVPNRGGSYRWIRIYGSIMLQPSEITKLSFILALGWYLRDKENYRQFTGLIRPFMIALVPIGLILLQPDLGMSMLFFIMVFGILFVAGARIRHLISIIMIGILLSPLFYLSLNTYQRNRIIGMLHQNSNDVTFLRGNGYQLYQSKICIGSGGLTGHGLGKGIYVERPWLPERHNDFIFALIAHQWGFVGGVVILLLYGLILIGGIEIAAQQVDSFGKLLAIGIVIQFASQMFINIGMTMGVMPVTGMALPFVSYGGSSLLCNFIALGLLINVARHRPAMTWRNAFEFGEDLMPIGYRRS